VPGLLDPPTLLNRCLCFLLSPCKVKKKESRIASKEAKDVTDTLTDGTHLGVPICYYYIVIKSTRETFGH
jgi:hypothetical protein